LSYTPLQHLREFQLLNKKDPTGSSINSWLGKWFLFQTFEELDSVKDKELEVQQIRELLEADPKTSEAQ
jgi:hypothetical protein